MELYQIVLLVLAGIIGGLYIYKKVTGKDVLRSIMQSRPLIRALGAAVEAIGSRWPGKPEVAIVYEVIKATIEASEIAFKAWNIGNLSTEDRNIYAKALVKETLEKAGIEMNDRVGIIVDGIFEAVRLLLPEDKEKEEE